MKRIGLWFGLLLATAVPLLAQVTVEVTQDQDQFLPGEALPVAVRITNLSGQTLHLGAAPDWLTFDIESREGVVVSKKGDVPVLGEFTLDSSQVAIKRVNLSPYFAIPQPGRYGIVATLRIKAWRQELTSPAKYFNIIHGAKLWEQEVGVPNIAGISNAAPQVRTYILQQANYLRSQIRLYLRIVDDYNRVVCVQPIGSMVSFSRPESQVDRVSNLHVLYQNGPFTFSYTVYDLDGNIVARQTYDYTTPSRPRLTMDDQGTISVKGGVRRIARNDVPPPPSQADALEDVSEQASAASNVPPQVDQKK